MQTASLNPCLSLRELTQLDVGISHAIDETDPAKDPETARLLLRQRRWVRGQIDQKKAAESN